MHRLTVVISLLVFFGFTFDAFACGNSMHRFKKDPFVAANERAEWHLRRGENRTVLDRLNGLPYNEGAVDHLSKVLLKGKLDSPKRKRSVHLLAAAVVRSGGMWARSKTPDEWDQRVKGLGEVEARENLSWAVSVLEVLAKDSSEARAYLIEGRYRLDGDSQMAGRQLRELADSDGLPDGHSWALLADLTKDPARAGEARTTAAAILAAAQTTPKPRNERVRSRRDRDGVLELF